MATASVWETDDVRSDEPSRAAEVGYVVTGAGLAFAVLVGRILSR